LHNDAGTSNFIRQTRQRDIHTIAYVEGCLVDIRTQLKRGSDGQRTTGIRAGVEVE
jgi:hypothetical protein